MAKPQHFDRIEEYLTGQMTEKQAQDFEREAANDPQLAAELRLQRLEHDAMERMLQRDLKNKMSTTWAVNPPANPFEEKHEAKVVQMRATSNRRLLLIAAAIGGVLLIAALLWRLTTPKEDQIVKEPQKQETPSEPPTDETAPMEPQDEKTEIVETPEEPVNKKPEPKPERKPIPPPSQTNYFASADKYYGNPPAFVSSVRSGGVTDEKSPILMAAAALDKGQYQEALNLLGPPTEGESEFRYLRGHAYFKTKQFAEAAEQFQYMTTSELKPYHLESKWYLLLSYFAQLPRTEKEFNALASQMSENGPLKQQEKVKALLKEINGK